MIFILPLDATELQLIMVFALNRAFLRGARTLHLTCVLLLTMLGLPAPLRAQGKLLRHLFARTRRTWQSGNRGQDASQEVPKAGNPFVATALEFEYGVKAWWTTELYLDGQATAGESTVFTGFRLENRIRPLLREHWINPVLYFEFEDINGADKALLEGGWSRHPR